jgi:hypothetical protein
MFVGVEKKEYTEMNVYTLKDENTKNVLFWKKEGKMKKRNRSISEDEFEDTNEVIRIRTSKKDRQHNGQEKKDKQRNTKHKHKTKDRVTKRSLKTGDDLRYSRSDSRK